VQKILGEYDKGKGLALPRFITMSDCAYVVSLIENNEELWHQSVNIKALLPIEEQEKFKEKKHN